MLHIKLVHYSDLEKQGQTGMHLINMSRGIKIYICKVFHEYIRETQHVSCRVFGGCDDSCNSMRS